MLSNMECFSSVTAASQSEPVSFAEHLTISSPEPAYLLVSTKGNEGSGYEIEHLIDVCEQIQAMVWRNPRRNSQVYSVKNIFLPKGK